MSDFNISPVSETLGAEVLELDVSKPLDVETIATLRNAFQNYHLLIPVLILFLSIGTQQQQSLQYAASVQKLLPLYQQKLIKKRLEKAYWIIGLTP